MIKSIRRLLLSTVLLAASASVVCAQSKTWADVAAPEITSIVQSGDNELTVNFNLDTGKDGATSGSVVMTSTSGSSKVQTVGKTRKEAKSVKFPVTATGTYTFTAYGERKGEAKKASTVKSFNYILPLTQTNVTLLNIGGGVVDASWTPVSEAEGYILSYTDNGKKIELPVTKDLNATLPALKPGSYSDIVVTAVRGSDKKDSALCHKLIRAEKERVWQFTEFGTSTKPELNRYEVLDPNDLKVKLYSCTFDPKSGDIAQKGGKYESFFDGISFYYTVVDPVKENFELTATVTVDYINPMPDGQEGFGFGAYDTLGKDGEPMVVAYSNNASLISRKFTTHVNGVKKEIKDGLGARFVWGLTPEVLSSGDAAVSQNGVSQTFAFSYDQASDAIKTGDVYRITLKKDNTGYHTIYKRAIPSEDTVEEFIMYDNRDDGFAKLRQLDKDNIYVGFTVARGCNATFSDVVFTTSDPATDPKGLEEPPELVPLTTLVDCPTAYFSGSYPFVFTSNAQGTIHVEDTEGKVYIKEDKVLATEDYKKTIKLNSKGITDLLVTFTPEEGWRPQPKQVIAQYNNELKIYEMNYKPVTYTQSVIVMTYKAKELYVTPNGTAFGSGTKEDPLDLLSAIRYAKPGQEIVLQGGTYYLKSGILIERGNDGTAKKHKVLRAENGKRAVLNFNDARKGFELYGSYWTLQDIDITKTFEDIKGIQVAGSYNILNRVDAYLNGDTGIQISGRASEPYAKWPHDNLIVNCESFGNCDPAMNNADGFASKLTSGDNNVFRNCIAHHNVDDGWDLYSKTETGPIGAVLLDNCVVYGNGVKIDGSGKGDGNGFKLGGDGIGIPHLLRNSISFGNTENGVTTNSNPALMLENVTVYGNGSYGINLYGKGNAESYPRSFKATGVISLENGSGDKLDEVRKYCEELINDDNYFYNGSRAVNKSGVTLDKSIFESYDMSLIENGINADGSFNRIKRNADGSFDMGSLFKLNDKAPANAGARR